MFNCTIHLLGVYYVDIEDNQIEKVLLKAILVIFTIMELVLKKMKKKHFACTNSLFLLNKEILLHKQSCDYMYILFLYKLSAEQGLIRNVLYLEGLLGLEQNIDEAHMF